jgi:hypothetical protein
MKDKGQTDSSVLLSRSLFKLSASRVKQRRRMEWMEWIWKEAAVA